MKSTLSHFESLQDPRLERTRLHLLSDIIFISIAAVICGAETWNAISAYGVAKEAWLKQYLNLENGIPSHDTFNRFFSTLEPERLEACFLNWIKDVVSLTEGEVVSIDGKAIRGSRVHGSKALVHMVSAWSQSNHMTLGQIKVDEKSNEITAIPKLLELLAIKGCIVTIDAMGCQIAIAEKIREKEADYLLAVKGNQGTLEQNINDTIRFCKPFEIYQSDDFGHGRIETRVCTVYSDLSHIANLKDWKDLTCVIKIESTRCFKLTGKEEKQTRLYISSIKPCAKKIEEAVRAHWAIENNLHWMLDVSFGEDKSMKTNPIAVQNFSMISKIALSLIKKNTTKKGSVKQKRLTAGWNNGFLTEILKN
jgi:predicted transposase YbfD/YdcC